jgi:hypothetical protein
MNTVPLTHRSLDSGLRVKRILMIAIAIVAVALTLVIVALSISSGSRPAQPIDSQGQTLMHFYGTGAPPLVAAARPQTSPRETPRQHFYGLQP